MKTVYFTVSYDPITSKFKIENTRFAPLLYDTDLFSQTGNGWDGIVSAEDKQSLETAVDIFTSKMID